MLITTRNFGEVNIEEKDKIIFPNGLLGFEDKKEYILINNYDTEEPVPFMWLQSVQDPDLSFVVSIPFLLKPQYEVTIKEDVCQKLNLKKPETTGVYTICTIKDKVEDMTVNFQSPLIINTETRQGEQIVLFESPYSMREPIK